MKIRAGDVVKVIAGSKSVKGIVGKVVSVDRVRERVFLDNGPVHKKHMKPERSRKHPEGGIIDRAASVHISNVMLMSESLGRPVRVGSKLIDGVKTRVTKGKASGGEKV